MPGDARRGHRRRREHAPIARGGAHRAPGWRSSTASACNSASGSTSSSAGRFRATGSTPRGASRAGRPRRRDDSTATRVEVVVTSPGRQAANADELVASLSRVRGATRPRADRRGGGELRLPRRARLGRRPCGERRRVRRRRRIDADRRRVARGWAGVGPLARHRLAAAHAPGARPAIRRARRRWSRARDGGRAALRGARRRRSRRPRTPPAAARGNLGKLVGPQLGAEELAVALHILAERPSRRLAKTFDISPSRARTLPAGALLLACDAAAARRSARGRAHRPSRGRRALAARRDRGRGLEHGRAPSAGRRGRGRTSAVARPRPLSSQATSSISFCGARVLAELAARRASSGRASGAPSTRSSS